ENLVHLLRQFGQNDLAGPFESFNITLVINQFYEHTCFANNCLYIQYFCFGGFVCQGMNHLFLNFGEHTAGVFVIDFPCRADGVWR
ncbi:hypothetical protein, partial [Salmonella enterica subsp. enterica serovar Enteritidis]